MNEKNFLLIFIEKVLKILRIYSLVLLILQTFHSYRYKNILTCIHFNIDFMKWL